MDDAEKKDETRRSVDEEWAEALGMEIQQDAKTPPPVIPPVPKNKEQQVPEPPKQPEYHQAAPEPPSQLAFGEPMPPTYMVWAVLVTLCCCLLPGVVAIYFSAMVSSRFYARDYEGAKRASHNAEIWIIISIVLGVISAIFYLPFALLSMQ
jgi:hypothetical protein